MQALTLTGPGKLQVADHWPEPDCGSGDVLVEPNYCCLRCSRCRAGHTSACEHRDIVDVNLPGLLAECAAVPAEFA